MILLGDQLLEGNSPGGNTDSEARSTSIHGTTITTGSTVFFECTSIFKLKSGKVMIDFPPASA